MHGKTEELTREHARDAAKREALDREPEQVVVRRGDAPALRALERRRLADVVTKGCGGHVDRLPAAKPGAPAHVDLLELHEERLVEAAELEQQVAPDEHRGTVREQ